MSKLDFRLTKIIFKNKLTIDLESDSILVIVGPNNSGKTSILREIEEKVISPNESSLNLGKVITSISKIDKSKLVNHLVNGLNLKEDNSYGSPRYEGFGAKISLYSSDTTIKFEGDVISAFILYVDTITRLQVIQPTTNISLTYDAFTHPIHYLIRYEELEDTLNKYVRDVFDFDVILNLYRGQEIHLMIGDKPKFTENKTRFETAQIYDSLIPLRSQGDGIKGYIGVLISIIAAVQKVILIDEPENFLHPPQANKLGKLIGNYSKLNEKQIFLTTHSLDFLKGILDSNNQKLQIIRINKSHVVSALDNKICNEIWHDPVLKSSNLLDGLFHDMVIICEADADVKFYSLIFDHIGNQDDILFIPSYGKDKVIKMQDVLNKLGVDNKCILDFDSIADKEFIKKICSINSISFDSIKSDYEPIFEFLKSKNKDDFKRAGCHILSSGIQSNYTNLKNILNENNIFLVEEGELESFIKSKKGKSGKWLNEVLTDIASLEKNNELSNAINFLTQVINKQ